MKVGILASFSYKQWPRNIIKIKKSNLKYFGGKNVCNIANIEYFH